MNFLVFYRSCAPLALSKATRERALERVEIMSKIGILLASSFLGALIGFVFLQQWPDVQRYLRMRAM